MAQATSTQRRQLALEAKERHGAQVDEDKYTRELWVRSSDGERGILHGNPHDFVERRVCGWADSDAPTDPVSIAPSFGDWLRLYLSD